MIQSPAKTTAIIPVILCGGSGTRLWPLSRTGFPKQFLCLTGGNSLFQEAAQRLVDLGSDSVQVGLPVIVTGEEHRFLALEQLREAGIGLGQALLEPVGRNTAPALTLAAFAATESGQDPIMVVTPADQTVTDSAAFKTAMQKAIEEAAKYTVVILGVAPHRPETGYGYIQVAQADGGNSTKLVTRFVEKPDAATAQTYIDVGGYYWNAGIFVLKASVWLKALKQFRPDIFESARVAWSHRSVDSQFVRPGNSEFAAIPAESVDYAVMERCPGSDIPIKMVSLDAGWSDLGAWDAVWNVKDKDAYGNAHQGDVLSKNAHNTLVHATSRLVSLVGVSNLVVIETPDAVLVADKAQCQGVKHIVAHLQDTAREEQTLHRKVHRPWGWYDSIDQGDGFKVKRIQVAPGASLSLQKHQHRAEHWIVVRGEAEIVRGKEVVKISKNQSTYIPRGEIHRLSNSGAEPLEIIEVQSGDYLGEDDIVRLEDTYGRIS